MAIENATKIRRGCRTLGVRWLTSSEKVRETWEKAVYKWCIQMSIKVKCSIQALSLIRIILYMCYVFVKYPL